MYVNFLILKKNHTKPANKHEITQCHFVEETKKTKKKKTQFAFKFVLLLVVVVVIS